MTKFSTRFPLSDFGSMRTRRTQSLVLTVRRRKPPYTPGWSLSSFWRILLWRGERNMTLFKNAPAVNWGFHCGFQARLHFLHWPVQIDTCISIHKSGFHATRFVSFFVCKAATPLTLPRSWERIRVVRSSTVTVKFLAQIERHSRNGP